MQVSAERIPIKVRRNRLWKALGIVALIFLTTTTVAVWYVITHAVLIL